MNQKSVRITSALTALTALAAAVVAVFAVSSSGILSAQSATTKIDLLNVGMCVTTDDSVFKEADCDDGNNTPDDTSFTVRDRDGIVERETVYATYASDPKSGGSARAIVMNSDLIKISIKDPGRDRRRSVLYPAEHATGDYGTLLDGEDGDDVLDRIIELLKGSTFADKLSDVDNIAGFDNDDIVLYQPSRRTNNAAVIEDSGAATLNFKRSGDPAPAFLPLSEDEENDVVIFFGFEVDEGNDYANDFVQSEVDTVGEIHRLSDDALEDEEDGLKILGAGSSGMLIPDEDRTSGGGDKPPWLTVLANMTTGKDVVIVAVLYETSEREFIFGGTKCDPYVAADVDPDSVPPITHNDVGKCKGNAEQSEFRPNFTESERTYRSGEGRELVALVEGSGGQASVNVPRNLLLQETSAFSGTYVGYVRLTDGNGDGRGTGSTRTNWGRQLRHAFAQTSDGIQRAWNASMGSFVKPSSPPGTQPVAVDDEVSAEEGGSAVVGVERSLVIKYRDSQGGDLTERIEIDRSPPTINVASPRHLTSSGDRSPDFVGTFVDTGSGLAEDTFRLYVDNISDGGDGIPDGPRLEDTLPVLNIRSMVTGTFKLTDPNQYTGYIENPAFGIVSGRPDSEQIYFDEEGDSSEADTTYDMTDRKIVLAEDYDDGDRMGSFDEDARVEGSETEKREIEVDFQAVVIDLAGNVGFSDSNPSQPTRIDDRGTAITDRLGEGNNDPAPNVLGVYSRHVFILDDKDPAFDKDDGAITGYYGLDSDDEPMPHQRGIMLVFDAEVSDETITPNTFTVELDDKTNATVDDVTVEDNLVFLRLAEDLDSSETPMIGIASGHRVVDLAGNQLQAREVTPFKADDGLPPTLTVSLSGGSGRGEGDQSSSSLTDEEINIVVTSNEELNEAPNFVVLCDEFTYGVTESQRPALKEADFIEERTGALTGEPDVPSDPALTGCGASATRSPWFTDDNRFVPVEIPLAVSAGASMTWEGLWTNSDGANAVPDGEVTVVVYARDTSSYRLGKNDVEKSQNWTTTTIEFTLDSTLLPLVTRDKLADTVNAGTVLPRPEADVTENRPFIILDFSPDASDVTVERLLVDGVDVTARLDRTQRNYFVYQTDSLSFGVHKVEVDAVDNAGNDTTFKYEFDVTTRSAFQIRLNAGWNAISIPQNAVDGSLETVFSNAAIDQVISYIRPTASAEPRWAWATRQDGVWTTSYGELTEITAGNGYWVHTDRFVTQEVPLHSPDRLRLDRPSLIGISTSPGWNFVGVVDQDGDQTQADSWGKTYLLKSPGSAEGITQSAEMYLGDYVRAYTWDANVNQFAVLEERDPVTIGSGIWVYYGEGVAP